MLKYLMKYDLKKILKFLIWFYAVSLVLALVKRILSLWNDIQLINILSSVFASLTYSAIATIIINTFIHILARFSTSFYKDQSYLTHTLPVKKDTLILSIYLSGLIVVFSSVLVSFLSLFIVFYSPEFMQMLKSVLDIAVAGFNMSGGAFVLLMALIIFSQICAMMSLAFTAIVKGNSYNYKRGVKGFLWFVAFYIVCLNTTLILSVIIAAITGDLSSLFSEVMSSSTFLTVMIVALICYISYAVIFYFYCRKEFKKGVNVD